MDYRNLEVLRSKQEEGQQKCEEKIKQWEKFATDYEDLKERLLHLPDKVSYDIMVPICGKVALVPGKMIHTNEILVLLGEDYMVERSAKQAMEIVDRRLKFCDDRKKEDEEEKAQFENWIRFTSDVQKSEEVDIKEDYDEEMEQQWKEKHRMNVKKYKAKAASRIEESKTSSKAIEENEIQHSDIWARLDQLEQQEVDDEFDQSSSSEEDEDLSEDASETSSLTSDSSDEIHSKQQKKIAWADMEEKKSTTNIFFHHSATPVTRSTTNLEVISSPGDIFEKYLDTTKREVIHPKSILKQTSKSSAAHATYKDSSEKTPQPDSFDTKVDKNCNDQGKQFSPNLAFSGEILETASISSTRKQLPVEKPVSRFKARRMQK